MGCEGGELPLRITDRKYKLQVQGWIMDCRAIMRAIGYTSTKTLWWFCWLFLCPVACVLLCYTEYTPRPHTATLDPEVSVRPVASALHSCVRRQPRANGAGFWLCGSSQSAYAW